MNTFGVEFHILQRIDKLWNSMIKDRVGKLYVIRISVNDSGNVVVGHPGKD